MHTPHLRNRMQKILDSRTDRPIKCKIFRIRRTKYFRSQIFCIRLRTGQLTTGCAQNRLAHIPCTCAGTEAGMGQGVVHEPDRPWPIKSKRFCISRSSCVCVCADVCRLPAPTQNWLRVRLPHRTVAPTKRCASAGEMRQLKIN
jgi:hypothetical protein